MILIADAGSTKTAWTLCEPSGAVAPATFITPGVNPATQPPDEIEAMIASEIVPRLAASRIDAVYYYGAGIVSDEKAGIIRRALSPLGDCTIEVSSDMLGAARALLGSADGIAAILGTGSNSCLYADGKICRNVPPLGYILGDEGSGSSLGKRFVADVLRGLLPAEIADRWRFETGLSMTDVIERVYRRPGANTFLGSLAPFIHRQLSCEAVRRLVYEEFDRFFSRNIALYGCPGARLGFTGSVALHFRDVLTDVASAHGYFHLTIAPDPTPGLIAYHTSLRP